MMLAAVLCLPKLPQLRKSIHSTLRWFDVCGMQSVFDLPANTWEYGQQHRSVQICVRGKEHKIEAIHKAIDLFPDSFVRCKRCLHDAGGQADDDDVSAVNLQKQRHD